MQLSLFEFDERIICGTKGHNYIYWFEKNPKLRPFRDYSELPTNLFYFDGGDLLEKEISLD